MQTSATLRFVITVEKPGLYARELTVETAMSTDGTAIFAGRNSHVHGREKSF